MCRCCASIPAQVACGPRNHERLQAGSGGVAETASLAAAVLMPTPSLVLTLLTQTTQCHRHAMSS